MKRTAQWMPVVVLGLGILSAPAAAATYTVTDSSAEKVQTAIDPASTTQPANDPVSTALQASLATGVGHAWEWLEAVDYKSLAQSAGGLQTLANLLRARSDDAEWQDAIGKIFTAVGELREAARSEDRNKCRAALDAVARAATSAGGGPRKGSPLPVQRSQGGVRPLMLLMDGIRGDAKIALLTGRPTDAKNAAYVLSELGRVVANSRTGGAAGEREWSDLSNEFIQATLLMARSSAEDVPAVRQLLRDVSRRCDACHESR